MSRIPIVVPDFLMSKKDLEDPDAPQNRPIETLFKNGLVFWMKQPGDAVAEGETVCELEIEKKTAELEAPAGGVLAEQCIADGGDFAYGDVLGYIDSEAEPVVRERPRGEGPIALYVLSGFLGSGKTTLLKRLLEGYAGARIGVIVNEFGEVGIDGALLAPGGVKMVEITGGSIFCACLKDGFIRTLKAFSEQPIDTLFVENSGMSDPSSMNRVLKNLAPYLRRPYEYRGSICMIDCTSFVKYAEAFLPLERQVEASAFVVLNKTDLCPREQIEAARSEVLSINPDAFVVEAVRADVPLELLKAQLHNGGYDEKSLNTAENRPETVIIQDAEGVFAPERVEAFCRSVADVAMRIKGFFISPDGPCYLDVSSGIVGVERANSSSLGRTPCTRIVVIARKGTGSRRITDAWAEAINPTSSSPGGV